MTRSISSIDAPATRRISSFRFSAAGLAGASPSLRCPRRNATSRLANSRISPSTSARFRDTAVRSVFLQAGCLGTAAVRTKLLWSDDRHAPLLHRRKTVAQTLPRRVDYRIDVGRDEGG